MKKIILWRNRPIDVDIQLWENIAIMFDGKVVVLHSDEVLPERHASGISKQTDMYTYFDKKVDYEQDEQELLNIATDEENISIFFGFNKSFKTYMNAIKKEGHKFAIISEMPRFYSKKKFNIIQNMLLYMKYKWYKVKYNKSIGLFFAYGKEGVNSYKKLGFNANVLFPIMYNSECECNFANLELNRPLKMIYVGRFDYNIKGLDLAINAVKNFSKKNVQLDLVGGYGKNKSDVHKLINGCDNIKYIGMWQQKDVVKKMSDYDLCIVPSRFDGWNINVNHSIKAGIGCIATKKCVSSELISFANSGIVIDGNIGKRIAEAIQYALDNPQEVKRWKENARKYAPQLETAKVAKYVLDCIEMQFNIKEKKEIKPSWITK